jgi:hypothetical protein
VARDARSLPPRCVPDRHVVKMSAKVFGSWLRLVDEPWKALDAHARRTLNALVRLSITEQLLPESCLMLEMLDSEIDAAPVGLSPMPTGWSIADCDSKHSEVRVTSALTEGKDDGKMTTSETSRTTGARSRQEGVGDVGITSQKGTAGDVDDALLNDLDFDDCLSQEI